MPRYYVNKSAQDSARLEHEVHAYPALLINCPYSAPILNRVDLGYHDECSTAMKRARELGYAPVNGCRHCCSACHTGSEEIASRGREGGC